jgi:hypothetical protein
MGMVLAALTLVLATQPKNALELAIVVEPNRIRSGETVKASLIVRNPTKQPVSLVRAVWDGGLCGRAWIDVKKNGQLLHVTGGDSSSPAVQVMVNDQVTRHHFIELSPGESHCLYWITFNAGVVDNQRPHTKDAYARWLDKATPLSAGEYTIEGFYEYRKPSPRDESAPKYEFTPSAKRLFGSTFVGKLATRKQSFTVQ